MCDAFAQCVERLVPCVGRCMTSCNNDVVFRGDTRRNMCALTIDDGPLGHDPLCTLPQITLILKLYNARATFFLVWSRLKAMFAHERARYMGMLLQDGHEVGVHFAGRWGCCQDEDALIAEAREMKEEFEVLFRRKLLYVRPAGGFARHSTTLRMQQELQLTTVIGTAYPFDVDLCKHMSSKNIGRCAQQMAVRDGSIVILHDGRNITEKMLSFLNNNANSNQRKRVVTLRTLLDDIHSEAARPNCPTLNVY